MVMSYLRRAYSSFAAHVFDIPPRLMALVFFIILILLPVINISTSDMGILVFAFIFAILAMSWDLLVGRTGQISLGHALFFGIGGYVTALLFRYYGLPIYITIPVATVIGASVSLLIGFPCLRVKGPYLALVTMAFPLILSNLMKWTRLQPIFGGELGITGLPPLISLPILRNQRIAEYYIVLLILFISAVIIYKIANSKTGIVFMSILDDEVASKACGIDVTKHKLYSFFISGFFASLAGCLQAHFLRVANPAMLELQMSFTVIVVVFLGGIGTIYGPIAGTLIYYFIDKYILSPSIPGLFNYFGWTNPADFAKFLIFTVIVLVLVIKWPRGLAKFTTDKLTDLEEARDLDERGPRIWKHYKKKKTKNSTV